MIKIKVIQDELHKIKVIQDDIKAVAILGEIVTVQPNLYNGSYTVTPSQETQILKTQNKSLARNITINPIPKNYGRITYNGFEITVS